MRVRILLGKPMHPGPHLLAGLSDRDILLQPCDNGKIKARSAPLLRRIEHHWQPDLGISGIPELARHDTHDRVRTAVQLERFPQKVSAATGFPECITDHDDWFCAGLLFSRVEGTTLNRLRSQCLKE